MEESIGLTQQSYTQPGPGRSEDGFYSKDASNNNNMFSGNHQQEELTDDPIHDSSQDTKDSAESDGLVTASRNSDEYSDEGALFSDGTEVEDNETKANKMEEEIDELLFIGRKCSIEIKDVYQSVHQAEGGENSGQFTIESSSDLGMRVNKIIKLRMLKFSEALSILFYIITIVVAAEDLGKGQLIADTMKDDPWNQIINNDQSLNVFDLNNNVRIIAIYIITLSVIQIFTAIFDLPLLLQITKMAPSSSIQKYGINIIIGLLLNQLSHSGALVAKYLMIFDMLIFVVEYVGVYA